MKVIIDNNILFSLMNPNSFTSYLFSAVKAEFSCPRNYKIGVSKVLASVFFKIRII